MGRPEKELNTKASIDPDAVEIFERLRVLGMLKEIDEQADAQSPMVPSYALSPEHRQEIEEREKNTQKLRAWIQEEARQNQQYYIQEALKTGKPWHRNVKFEKTYSEYILLTPEMAQVLLSHNPRNRTVKENTLNSYKRDILNDCWLPTDESIGIDTNGNLYNGQHRSTAVVQTGRPTIFYFTFNVLPESKAVVDSGIRRTTTEKLQMMLPTTEIKVGPKLAAVARSMMRGVSNSGTKYSDTEIARFATKWHDTIVASVRLMPRCRADIQGAFAKAILVYGLETVQEFAHRFVRLDFLNNDDDTFTDPMKTLYKYWEKSRQDGGHRGLDVYKKTLSAIDAAVNGKSMARIYGKEKDLFDWTDEWDIKR